MKNYLSFRQLDSALIHKAALNESDIVPALRIAYINNKLMKIYRLLDGLNDPWYHKQSLAVSVAAEISNQALTFTGTTVVVRTTGTWKLGEIFTLVATDGTGTIVVDVVGIITGGAGTVNGTFTVLKGTPVDTGSAAATTGMIFGSPNLSTIDLSALYVKNITRLWDNGYTGGKERIFTEIKDPQIFAVLHRDPFFDTRVAWYHRGDSVLLYVPSGITLGTVNMEYRGKPVPCTDFDTDVYVDIPPEDNQVLMDEVLAEYLTHAGKPVPEDVMQRQAEFQKRYDAALADVERHSALIKGKRGG